jgi:hypothetical protein
MALVGAIEALETAEATGLKEWAMVWVLLQAYRRQSRVPGSPRDIVEGRARCRS